MLQNSETERSLTNPIILTYRLLKSETAVVLSVSRERVVREVILVWRRG